MDDDDIRRARRLCFFAHYHPRGIVADYVLHYLAELQAAGFTTIVMSTATLADGERAKLTRACARLIERENVGLDFGGWIEAFARFSPIEAELLLLANDSVYGPLTSLSDFVDRLTAVPADVYGAVESREGGTHLQSWFLLLRPEAYRSAAFARIMAAPIPADMAKREIITRYETALLAQLAREGLRHHAAYSDARAGVLARAFSYNPVQLLWRELITRFAIPFVKVEVLRDNPLGVGGVERWRCLVADRAPALVPMIETDLAARDARPLTGLRARLASTAQPTHVAYRPELAWIVARDAVGKSRRLPRLRLWAFHRLARCGTSLRRRFAR